MATVTATARKKPEKQIRTDKADQWKYCSGKKRSRPNSLDSVLLNRETVLRDGKRYWEDILLSGAALLRLGGLGV